MYVCMRMYIYAYIGLQVFATHLAKELSHLLLAAVILKWITYPITEELNKQWFWTIRFVENIKGKQLCHWVLGVYACCAVSRNPSALPCEGSWHTWLSPQVRERGKEREIQKKDNMLICCLAPSPGETCFCKKERKRERERERERKTRWSREIKRQRERARARTR